MEASRVSLLTTFLIFLICFVTCPLPPHKKHPRKTPLEHSSTFSSGHVKKSVSKRPSFGVSALAITEAEEEEEEKQEEEAEKSPESPTSGETSPRHLLQREELKLKPKFKPESLIQLGIGKRKTFDKISSKTEKLPPIEESSTELTKESAESTGSEAFEEQPSASSSKHKGAKKSAINTQESSEDPNKKEHHSDFPEDEGSPSTSKSTHHHEDHDTRRSKKAQSRSPQRRKI